jgi:hypothetical protein
MPKFVIERQYLLPVYQRLIIEAPSLESALEAAIGNDHSWEEAENDGDGAQPTTITAAKIAPPNCEEELKKACGRSLGTFLFENEIENGPLLAIPMRYRTREIVMMPPRPKAPA